ncbi:hypothetical protein L3X38_010048 [Prunus dulcis]|uniref:Uncharacterized protein n=1 Tax=Prunus dulcis TaxID=3755 RepID=A0AAD4ZEE4_PRUDU|nr:hypothetical protein L3X38_010048 [Prunus dulcis]
MGRNQSLFEIQFDRHHGILTIPKLRINDFAGVFIKNAIALNIPRDVKLLVENGIVEHGLGEEEQVAALFNRIAKGVDIKSNCFVEVCNDLNKILPKSLEQMEGNWKQNISTRLGQLFLSL